MPNEPETADGGVDVLTADGGIVRIRPVRQDDQPGLSALYDRASDESLYRRFFVGGRRGPAADIERVTRTDGPGHAALLAEHRGRVLGVASYEQAGSANQAEFAMPAPPVALGSRRTPVYPLPEQAVTALGHAARYGAWRAAPFGHAPELSNVDTEGARAVVTRALAGNHRTPPPHY
jgi:hypothetical protein